MKKFFLAVVVVLSFSFNLAAMWAMIPTEELVKETDLIVIGTLQDVKEFTKDDVDYSEGIILVENVIAGNEKTTSGGPLKFSDKIVIKWRNSSMIACPRVEHKGDENIKGIWLLRVESDGTVSSDYPWRFSSLDELHKIKKILRKTKVRRNLTKILVVNQAPSYPIEAQPGASEQGTEETPSETKLSLSLRGHSPFNAITVLLLFICLYWFLYRSRFRIR